MERERLTRLVQDAAAVERGDLAELNALADKFPWFAGAQVLRSLGVHKAGDVLSEENLRNTAAHVPSRTALFDLIHRSAKPAEAKLSVDPEPRQPATPKVVPPPTPIPELTVVEVAPAPTPTEKIVAPEPVLEVVPFTPVPDAVVELTEPTMEVAEIAPVVEEAPEFLIDAIEELHSTPAEEQIAADNDLVEDPLERQIMESALAHAYDISWVEADVNKPRPESHKAPVVDLPAPDPVVPISPLQPLEPARFVTRNDKLSFTDWLAASNDAPSEAPPVVKPRESVVPEAASDWLRQPEEKPKSAPSTLAPIQPILEKRVEVDTRSLIDNFIKQQTPPAQQKAEFFTPQQAAKRSLDDKTGMVTETLARVYAKQGNLPKAIEAYRRLALKYPEKSAYFAALQKELEAQLNK